jgi:ABC-type lipoprotein release transport system permease subunit
MFRNLRYSARSFTRTPGVALGLLFTVALGIASIVSVRGFVEGLTKPSFALGSRDRLVSVFGRDAQREAGPLSKQEYLYARSRHDLFQWVGAARVSPRTITTDGQTAFVSVAAVTPNLARVFGLPLNEGVVISHRMWQREFGSSDVTGEEIQIDAVTARISGIAPDWLEGLYRDRAVDVWMPLSEETLRRLDNSSRNLWVVARLGRGVSPSQMNVVVQPGNGFGELRLLSYTGVMPERAAHLSRIGTLLNFAAGAVFFIACVNVGLFLLGRASARFHETALRVAFGASRGRLARELLSDSVEISVAGGAVGMLLAVWTSYLVPALLYEQDAEHLVFAPNLFSIAEAALVFVGVMILCGLLPAIVIPLDRPMSVIQRDSTGASPAVRRLRLGLVAAQMTSCCVLVLSTAFLAAGLRSTLVTSAGRKLGNTVFATVQANPDYFQQAEKAAKSVPGVSGIAWAATLPGGQPMRQAFRIEPAQLPLREVNLDTDWITSDSLGIFDLPPKSGRMFGIADETCRAAIVNERAAEELFGRYTVGRTMWGPGSSEPVEIIGVVAMRESGKAVKKNRPTVYFDYTNYKGTPPRRITDMRFRVPIASELGSADFETNVVSAGYFDAVGSQLIAGQGFAGGSKSTGCRIGIVNQEAADLYYGGNALGAAVIDEQGRRTDIIGVVHSEPLGAFQRHAEPTLYLPMSQDVLTSLSMSMLVRVREANGSTLTALRRTLEEVPGRGASPVLVRTFETYLNQTSLAPLRIATLLLGAATTMALLLSVLGLFSALSDSARQRRRELAIRIALGASRWRIIGQVLGEGVRLACAGTVVGMAMSLGLSQWMSGIAPGSGSPALLVWAAAPLALAGVVTIASVLPARHALMTNPLTIMHDNT